MYFKKIEHLYNFRFTDIGTRLSVTDLGSDVHHIRVESAVEGRWESYCKEALYTDSFSKRPSQSKLQISGMSTSALSPGAANGVSALSPEAANGVSALSPGALSLHLQDQVLLKTLTSGGFGVCGSKWIFGFERKENYRFYGMGEKNVGFEKSGVRTKFWNTDVWSDFSDDEGLFGVTDPMYISIPYLLVQLSADHWAGILVDNPYAVFMDTGARQVIEGVKDSGEEEPYFYIGSTNGAPSLYLIYGASAADVTCKLQQLCGKVDRPPLWALGYHQSRWGYGSAEDLRKLDHEFTSRDIPCDALWLDIDYMRGYRVFTIQEEHFQDTDGVDVQNFANITSRKIVPILDPGVKRDMHYTICKEGLDNGYFCLTSENAPYVGFVWPGASLFPDFSLEEVRAWWADHTAELAAKGIAGFWIDMNDPSTGSSELEEMHFGKGHYSHASYHNQYANGMAEATYKGLKTALPDKRPFVLSRSGFTGINRYSAVWTGDNHSNYHHLRKAVEMQLSLSLSGVPFAGSDIGGFGCDAEPENFVDWYKSCFLFPFFRNHSADGTARQEPWAFGDDVLDVVRTYIRARYQLLPYLYNLFIEQERAGHPVIRPMLYHHPGFACEDSQFLVGDTILQAPKLEAGMRSRKVILPAGKWWDIWNDNWLSGPCTVEKEIWDAGTPIYLREGGILPLSRHADANDSLREIDFLICVDPSSESAKGSYRYEYDAGEGYGYENGEKGVCSIRFTFALGVLNVFLVNDATGWDAPLSLRLAVPAGIEQVEIAAESGLAQCSFSKTKYQLAGAEVEVKVSNLL